MWAYLSIALILFARLQADDNVEDASKAISSFFEARCLKNADAEAFQTLGNVFDGLGDCVHLSQIPSGTDEQLLYLACEDLPEKSYVCMESFINALEPCLDPKEKYLVQFVADSFNSSFEQICEHGVERIKELSATLEKAKCDLTHKNVIEECLPKAPLVPELEKPDFILTESDVCGDLFKNSECVMNTVREACQEEILVKLVQTVLDPYLDWCKKHVAENTID